MREAMLNKEESVKSLRNYFKKNKTATMNQLMPLLKTKNRMSVFRRLCDLDYISSFSAAGKYYTLKNIPLFNTEGIWIFNNIGFSRYGNLKETLIQFIGKSETGKTHHEIKKELGINLREALHHALFDLVNLNKISRITVSDIQGYLYISTNQIIAKKQIACRNEFKIFFKEKEYSDWIIIQILASIIRTTQNLYIRTPDIISDLALRNIVVSEEYVGNLLLKFDLKKTLDSL